MRNRISTEDNRCPLLVFLLVRCSSDLHGHRLFHAAVAMALVVMPPVRMLLIFRFWHQTEHLVKPDFVSLE